MLLFDRIIFGYTCLLGYLSISSMEFGYSIYFFCDNYDIHVLHCQEVLQKEITNILRQVSCVRTILLFQLKKV